MIDEKTIALVDGVIAEAGQRISKAKVVPLTDAELDAIIGPPLTLDEHRLFYRMYISLLHVVMSNADLDSESTVEALQTARSEMRSPVGLAALAELLQQQAWMDLLPAIVGTVKGKEMLKGKRSKPNPFKDAFVAFVQANPDMTLHDIQRSRDQWLDDDLGRYEKGAFVYYDHKGDEREIGEPTLRKWFTEGQKKAKNWKDS